MATLSTVDIDRIKRGLSRYWSNLREQTGAFTKTQFTAAIVAADAWVDANSVSYNNTLPTPFRTVATTSQKSLLLVAVILMRFNLNILKQVFGEVD
jgi:hypothetical protein